MKPKPDQPQKPASPEERQPYLPTEPPPPPPKREAPTDEPAQGPPTQPKPPGKPPAHAPSQRAAGGRHRMPRKETPLERSAVVIDQRRDRERNTRNYTGITSAAFVSFEIVG